MRVIFVGAECEPWAKTGGLGDVVDALARALGHVPGLLDEPVEVFVPRYRRVAMPTDRPVATLRVAIAHRRTSGRAPDAGRHVAVADTRTLGAAPDPGTSADVAELAVRSFDVEGYRVRLVDSPPAFDRDGIYGDEHGDFLDNARRFALLGRAAFEARRAEGRPFDVAALHDWHACPAAILRDLAYADDPIVGRAATTLTIHNLAYRGWLPRERVGQLGIGDDPSVGDTAGVDLLREGIRRADALNTVSPTYARDVLDADHGMGLDHDLRARGASFGGILNGIDERLWDPATDPAIAARYDSLDRSGKAGCRRDLCHRIGFDAADPGPLLGMVGRLDHQKGFDLVAGALPAIAAAGARVVALGSGDPGVAEELRTAGDAQPGRIVVIEEFDREMARRIYAGADLFLMPSRFEPCGIGQMIAMRYATPPIARRTGGLADTVVDLDEDPAHATGFLFDEATPEAFAAACERAINAFSDPDRRRWEGLVRRAMARDWSWERTSAPAYAAMFRRAVAARRDRRA